MLLRLALLSLAFVVNVDDCVGVDDVVVVYLRRCWGLLLLLRLFC